MVDEHHDDNNEEDSVSNCSSSSSVQFLCQIEGPTTPLLKSKEIYT